MTMHGSYGQYEEGQYEQGQYEADETDDLVRSLALSSAKLWEELFERLRRLEVAQSEVRELLARIEHVLPPGAPSTALPDARRRAGELPAAAQPEPVSPSLPEPAPAPDDLAGAPPPVWGAAPSEPGDGGSGEERPGPFALPGDELSAVEAAVLRVEEALAPPISPPPNPQPPPPPPPTSAPPPFTPGPTFAPPPPPAGFSMDGAPAGPPSNGSPAIGSPANEAPAIGAAPPPPPPGFSMASAPSVPRDARAPVAVVAPPPPPPGYSMFSTPPHEGDAGDGAPGRQATGLQIREVAETGALGHDDSPHLPPITPDFFARAGRRRH